MFWYSVRDTLLVDVKVFVESESYDDKKSMRFTLDFFGMTISFLSFTSSALALVS